MMLKIKRTILCSSPSTAISEVNKMIKNMQEIDKIPADKYYSQEKCKKRKTSQRSRTGKYHIDFLSPSSSRSHFLSSQYQSTLDKHDILRPNTHKTIKLLQSNCIATN